MKDCSVCRFFKDGATPGYGECRRRAPVITESMPSHGLSGQWPRVHYADVCGEFEPDDGDARQ